MAKTAMSAKAIEKELTTNTGLTRKKGEAQDKWIIRLCAAALSEKNKNLDDLAEAAYDFGTKVADAVEAEEDIPDFDGEPIAAADDEEEADEPEEKPAKKVKGKKAKAAVEEDEEEAEEEDAEEEEAADDEDADDSDDSDDEEEGDDSDDDAEEASDEDDEEEAADDEDEAEEDSDEEDSEDEESDDSDTDEDDEDESDDSDDEEEPEDEDDDMKNKHKRLSKTNDRIKSKVTGDEVSATEAFRHLVLSNPDMLDPYSDGRKYDRHGLLKLCDRAGIKIGKDNASSTIFQTRATVRAIRSIYGIKLPAEGPSKMKKAKHKDKPSSKPAASVKKSHPPAKKGKKAR